MVLRIKRKKIRDGESGRVIEGFKRYFKEFRFYFKSNVKLIIRLGGGKMRGGKLNGGVE